MGTSKTAAEFSNKLIKMGTITQARQKEIVNQGALTAKEIIYAQAATDGITPASKIAGGRWGVRYDIKGFNNPTALVRVWGPFHLADSGTKPHVIVAKHLARSRASGIKRAQYATILGTLGFSSSGSFGGFFPTTTSRRGTRSRAGKRALSYAGAPGGKAYAYVHHPGTPGKHSFPKAKAKAKVAVPIVMQKGIVSGWRQALQ